MHIFIAIDPTGGGPSALTIVSGYYERDGKTLHVIGNESCRARSQRKEIQIIIEHINRVCEQYSPKVCKSVIIVNNIGNDASRIGGLVTTLFPDIHLYRTPMSTPSTIGIYVNADFIVASATMYKNLKANGDLIIDKGIVLDNPNLSLWMLVFVGAFHK